MMNIIILIYRSYLFGLMGFSFMAYQPVKDINVKSILYIKQSYFKQFSLV